MIRQQCVSCDGSKSIYGHMCSDCRLLINGCIKENVQTKKVEALKRPKRRKKQKILSTLDILISVFVVTPLVVACWRGTWQLMDVYADYFPPWESFLIGTTIHIIFAISQESFHDILNREHSSMVRNVCVFLLMKLYTIVFNSVTNMHWRGSWIIVDHYFGITITETGKTEIEDGRGALTFFTFCFLIMFFMKSLRNLNSPPFELCLDYGDDMFLFPSMFKVKFTLFAAVSTQHRIQKLEEMENTNLSTIPQKLLGLKSAVMMKIYPRPFQIEFHGKPEVFTVTSTTAEYPFHRVRLAPITPFRNIYYPNSIQEIIANGPQKQINKSKYENNSLDARYLLGELNYGENITQGFKKIEPFQEFKPSHPGEINLMAVTSFRFAPPLWKSYSSKYQRDTLAQQFLPSNKQSSKASNENVDMEKPISITFNVMPMERIHKRFTNFFKEVESRLNKSRKEMLRINLQLASQT